MLASQTRDPLQAHQRPMMTDTVAYRSTEPILLGSLRSLSRMMGQRDSARNAYTRNRTGHITVGAASGAF